MAKFGATSGLIQVGVVVHKTIPSLVDLLKPLHDHLGAPPLALGLLTHIIEGNNMNKVAMVGVGAQHGLIKYLLSGPQDAIKKKP
jgi:hypothetical protein